MYKAKEHLVVTNLKISPPLSHVKPAFVLDFSLIVASSSKGSQVLIAFDS